MTKAHWQNGQMTTMKEKKVWFQSANAQVIGLEKRKENGKEIRNLET